MVHVRMSENEIDGTTRVRILRYDEQKIALANVALSKGFSDFTVKLSNEDTDFIGCLDIIFRIHRELEIIAIEAVIESSWNHKTL